MRSIHGWVSRLAGVSWAESRQGITTNLWISLIGLAVLTPLIWCFDLVGGPLNNTVLNLLYAAIPLLLLLDAKGGNPESRRLNLGILASVAVLTVVLVVAVGDEYDLIFLRVNGSMLFISLPALFVFLKLIWMKPLLGFGIVPAMVLALFYLVRWGIPAGNRIDYVLVPFPMVLIIGVVLALVGWVLLARAERLRQRLIYGPLLDGKPFDVVPVLAAHCTRDCGSQNAFEWGDLVGGVRYYRRGPIQQRGLGAAQAIPVGLGQTPAKSQVGRFR